MENPFSTKFWSAGALPFQFSQSDESIETLLESIRQHPICQIVGLHGSGKSTLLQCLIRRFEQNGEDVRYLFFNDQSRCLPDDFIVQPDQIIFADGFERLRFWDRLRLKFEVKRLIFTTHRACWFIPVLYRTQPEFSMFVQLVQQLVFEVPEKSTLRSVYEHSDGNFRSAFFELYDQWEKQH